MKNTITSYYILSFVLLVISMLFLLNTYGQNAVYTELVNNEQTKLYEEASLISRDYVPNINTFNKADTTLHKHFSSLQHLTNMRVWIVNSVGDILMDSEVLRSKEGKNINDFDPDFLTNQTSVGICPDRLINISMVSVVYPVIETLDTTGYLVLFSPEEELTNNSFRYIDTLFVCHIIILILTSIIMLFLYYKTIRPIRSITQFVHEYSNGNRDKKMNSYSIKEFNELSLSISYLTEQVNGLNQYQQRFIANVSHDFRSPLTSISGYTQALADGTIPPEMQQKYFDIILFEVERLKKLTESLLTLNQLEQGQMKLNIVDFDINTAIRNTSASFEQRCNKKNISLDITFCSQTLYVKADKDRIQQVIQNLLDNAIKFSHNDSTIDITVTTRLGKVFVSVKDHGIGIPKESLRKIWSRFYKTDLSRGKDKTGSGLGLSITKEILESHGENINVISTEGVGTEFIFSLQISDEQA